MTRVCKKCNTEKKLEDFYLSGKKDQRKWTCKLCEIDRVKKWQKDHRDQYLKTRRDYVESGRHEIAAKRHRLTDKFKRKDCIRTKIYIKKYPQKNKARRLARAAMKRGDIKRMPCCICGKNKSHAHHEDYAKPLDVIFLCPKHHVHRHKNMDEPFSAFAIRNHI